MVISSAVIALVLAYLAGSIPSAVWAGKLFHGIDVREHGSGNAGATNTMRVLGWKTGIPVLIFDLFKGWLAAMLPEFLQAAPEGSETLMILQIACGLAAIIGHVFPLFAGFRGGKGVATTFGVLLALHPLLTLTCAGIFLLVLLASGYVSLGSMTAVAMFPILLVTLFRTPSVWLIVFSTIVAVAVIITHKKNIKRLLRGEEKRFIRRRKE
ncbi:MAG: glycerol-3-phosphate 1-O-acyltransferase PlsY [Bacteroidales bacterium]|jgi:glycerol-3-phosphate acyltransferase PlsY|nr:glycerol-3-phosphate 1-O-acyltransferase PlsY [Bacteroidales bacterium]MDD3735849.1 glycerol-3-phosphate 1-O-acyltransferase PlsY [Bacteroidales bacterium]HOO67074.1 glycerol-3-phosphate 1-O-acyltransferase PlsY [Bacteroidales bacterium]HPE22681.1 glycerol-3-phosphate 1-O-acyltransferase PlsY [Bacteroidales bacterium]HPJ04216.1 glycerol-3-phosphate 1-O-acyltransferase PlsY [Bacteroidales bacterium]